MNNSSNADIQTEVATEEDEGQQRRRRLAVQEIIGHLSNRSDVDGILILEPQTRSLLKFHFSDRFSGEIFSKWNNDEWSSHKASTNDNGGMVVNAGIVDQFQKHQDRLKQQALQYAFKIFQMVDLSNELSDIASGANEETREAAGPDGQQQLKGDDEGGNKVNLLRIRSKNYEFVITPDKGYILVIIHCFKH